MREELRINVFERQENLIGDQLLYRADTLSDRLLRDAHEGLGVRIMNAEGRIEDGEYVSWEELGVTNDIRQWILFRALQIHDAGRKNQLEKLVDVLATREVQVLGPVVQIAIVDGCRYPESVRHDAEQIDRIPPDAE